MNWVIGVLVGSLLSLFATANILSSNPRIVIKKADKGSAVVVMNTIDYLREGYRQLNDTKFYTKLDHDPTQRISQKIADTLTKMHNKGLISDKNLQHLTP